MSSSSSSSSLMNSMTDLMTSLMVIFILLLVVYINRTVASTQESSQLKRQLLMQQLKAQQITSEIDNRDPLSLIIRIDEGQLQFDTNKAIIKPTGLQFLKEFTPKIAHTLCDSENKNNVESLLIQGFTDSVGDDESNLELSQDRAFNVTKSILKTSAKHRECLLNLLSSNGRGERELKPVGARSGKEDKAKSRRVELKIRVKSFEQKI